MPPRAPSVQPKIEIALRAVCLLAIPALACCLFYSARAAVAAADYRQNTPESLARAVHDDPGNASYHQLYAEQLESSGQDPTREREAAALSSPLDSHYWIDLGTLAEVHADYPAAERYYLKAASVDKMFGPRWALMNYYFRRHEEPKFWQWTEQAMAMAYGDVTQIFRLCWLMTSDADVIRQKIPDTDYMSRQYLNFLMNEGHMDATAPVALKLAADAANVDDANLLLDYCGRALSKDTATSVEVWNRLSQRGLEHFDRLDAVKGAIITNGDFRTPPLERGFDWHYSRSEGVSVTGVGGADAGLTVELTGDQAQSVNLVNQWIPVDPNGSYRIEYRYSGGGEGPMARSQASGVTWEIENPLTGAVLARSADLKSGTRGEPDHLDFAALGIPVAMLSLRYEREPGTVRRPEKFTIQKVASQALTR